jgi:two-component system response regulator LytT
MKVLIVEDERPAAERLKKLLAAIDESIQVIHVLESVEETVNWLLENPHPSLIFMDIQLDDGLCFEIFENSSLDVPVIFTTAYNEYSLRAFKVNSIDYLLKPIEETELRSSIQKFERLHGEKKGLEKEIKKALKELQPKYRNRFLIKIGSRYKSVSSNDISCFIIREKEAYLVSGEGRNYGIDFSLDQIAEMLDTDKFYRINRSCIVNVDYITELLSYSSSRLQLTMENMEEEDLFVVSRDRVGAFKRWMDR